MGHPPIIIHLDDHALFRAGLKTALMPVIGGYDFVQLSHPTEAIKFFICSMELAKRVPIIITDLNHPGINGYEFARQIKELAIGYQHSVQILLLTMCVSTNELIPKGIQEKVFDAYLQKSASSEELIEVFNILLLN